MSDKDYTNITSELKKQLQQEKYVDVTKKCLYIFKELDLNDLRLYNLIRSVEKNINQQVDPIIIESGINHVLDKFKEYRQTKAEQFSNLIIAVVSYSLIPALTFVAVYIKSGEAPMGSVLTMSLAVYCMSITLSIKGKAERIMGLFFSLFVFVCFAIQEENKENADLIIYVNICTSMVIALFLWDRIHRHLLKSEQIETKI